MTAAVIFASAFGLVLALGLQSLSVNSGQRALAFANSFVIGTFNLALLKLVPEAREPLEIAAYLTGGPIGIVTAIALHPRLVRLLRGRE
jgi:hypothetical protein